MSDKNLQNSVNIGVSDNSINLNDDAPIIATSGKVNNIATPTVPDLEPWHYFKFACYFILIDLVIIGILGVIVIICPSREHVATQLIQICFYPLLTLMLGYVFAKGIPKKKK